MDHKRVTCAVMIRDGRVLLARRSPGQKNAGLWEFPGGKVEKGESDAECLAREIREEFGVGGTVGAHVCESHCVYEEYDLEITLCAYLFVPESEQFDLQVHDAVDWYDKEALKTAALSPADLPIAEAVRKLLK
ncbi:MAG: (deoxy)nucleoside triphosphate pyrophosphohydrolase [Clostridia bacterium]|nr:(deoxy)nucleoside triphosphate pyrophosphohydrolase [Clostridia bacterium]